MNLGADVVVHYDPWWNVAAQDQATDRAHRIGQKRNVQVYKLAVKDSIEERYSNFNSQRSLRMQLSATGLRCFVVGDDKGGSNRAFVLAS